MTVALVNKPFTNQNLQAEFSSHLRAVARTGPVWALPSIEFCLSPSKWAFNLWRGSVHLKNLSLLRIGTVLVGKTISINMTMRRKKLKQGKLLSLGLHPLWPWCDCSSPHVQTSWGGLKPYLPMLQPHLVSQAGYYPGFNTSRSQIQL